jgi:hypothetical protein
VRVFVSDLEMQRGQVLHHQRHRPPLRLKTRDLVLHTVQPLQRTLTNTATSTGS